MANHLNQGVGFDQVRWTVRKKGHERGCDWRKSFQSGPKKVLFVPGTHLYRLVPLTTGNYFNDVWWMPKETFQELHDDANRSRHGGGRLFRNYVAQYLSLPPNGTQLCIVEIELTAHVYGWTGPSSSLFGRPGGLEQVFLPNLAERGDPSHSSYAKLVHTYWLRF